MERRMEEKVSSKEMLAELPAMVASEKQRMLSWICAICTKENSGDEVSCTVCKRSRGKVPNSFLPFHPQYKTWEGANHAMEYKKWDALLGAGIDPNIADTEGWTGLHWATAFGREDLVSLLLQSGASVNAVRKDGWTPLHLACQGDYLECVRILTQFGADVNAATFTESMTPLHVASLEGNHKIVSELLALDVEVNVRMMRSGWTPLHLAAMRGHLDVVRVLLSTFDFADCISEIDKRKVPDTQAYDFDGWTPANIATLRGHKILSDYFKSHGASDDANSRACEEFVKHAGTTGKKTSPW